VAVRRITIEPLFEAWRTAARSLLKEGVAPDEVQIVESTTPRTLESSFPQEEPRLTEVPVGSMVAPRAFVESAKFSILAALLLA
jgi:hypothetical protein